MDDAKKRKTEDCNGAAELTLQDALRLLQPLSKDQLAEIVRDSMLECPDVLDGVRAFTDKDAMHRKLFVRGLGSETTSQSLERAFSSRYGAVTEAVVVRDKSSGRSKGYGFVTFRHADSAVLALKSPTQEVDGRAVAVSVAGGGSGGAGTNGAAPDRGGGRKVYVGGVPQELAPETLLALFSQYGEIEEGPLGFDRQTGKSRGYAIFKFRTEEGAARAVADPAKNLDGHKLNCRYAQHNTNEKPPSDEVRSQSNNLPPLLSSVGLGHSLPSSLGLGHSYPYSKYVGGYSNSLTPPSASLNSSANPPSYLNSYSLSQPSPSRQTPPPSSGLGSSSGYHHHPRDQVQLQSSYPASLYRREISPPQQQQQQQQQQSHGGYQPRTNEEYDIRSLRGSQYAGLGSQGPPLSSYYRR